MFNRKTDIFQETVGIILIGGFIVFVIVEIVSVIIGVTMTRTITGAVHRSCTKVRREVHRGGFFASH